MHGKARDFIYTWQKVFYFYFCKFVVFSILLRTWMVHSEVYFIIYSALSTPPYFLLYVLWKLLKGFQKTYQFLKIFMAVIQDHLDIDIDIDTLLILYRVICCIALRVLQTDFGFFCSVNHFSEGEVNANHNVTCSPSLTENDSDYSKIAKEIAMVSGLFVKGRRQTLLYSCKWQEWEIS